MSIQAKERKKCTKRSDVLVDCHVRINLEGMLRWMRWSHDNSTEAIARELEKEAKELEEFIRDHRSQDDITLEVVRQTKDLCSICGSEWETDEDSETGVLYCANCGADVEVSA